MMCLDSMTENYEELVRDLRENAEHYCKHCSEKSGEHLCGYKGDQYCGSKTLLEAADAIEELGQEKEQALYDYREEIIRTLHEHKRSFDMRDRYGDYGMGFSEAFKIVCMMPLSTPPKEDEA